MYFFFPPSKTTIGVEGPPAGVYTRSVRAVMERAEEGDVVVLLAILSMKEEDSRPVIEAAAISYFPNVSMLFKSSTQTLHISTPGRGFENVP